MLPPPQSNRVMMLDSSPFALCAFFWSGERALMPRVVMNDGTPATVFIADDDVDTRSAIEKAVRSVGLRTEVYDSAASLVAHVALDRPGCIILDLRQDTLDAFKMLEQYG